MRQVLLPVAGLLVGAVLAFQVADRPPEPMPKPSPKVPAPKTPTPAGPGVTQAQRFEIVDASGRVQIVLTSENGVPVALVNDGGAARRIDLAKVARLAK